MTFFSFYRVLWGIFSLLLVVICWLALQACVLKLPLFGELISRCSSSTVIPFYAEKGFLEDELARLGRSASLSPSCSKDTIVPFKELEVNEAEEIRIILDTSASMYQWAKEPDNLTEASQAIIESNNLIKKINDLSDTPASNSGEYSLSFSTEEAMQKYHELLRRKQAILDAVTPTRWKISKDSISSLLESMPDQESIEVWGFGSCGGLPVQLHPDNGASRQSNLSDLNATTKTALAEAIDALPSMLSYGVGKTSKRGANVVIFSDGLQSCPSEESPRDVCASARAVKRLLPHTWIHVVALAEDLDGLRCISEATGGGIIEVDEADQLLEILKYVSKNTE